jgi:ribonuclease BN (tRNA processing enzyme)
MTNLRLYDRYKEKWVSLRTIKFSHGDHRTGLDAMFQHRWLHKLTIKVQVFNPNLVAMRMPCADAYNTRFAMQNASAAVQRAAIPGQ